MTLPELLDATRNGSQFHPVGDSEPLRPRSLVWCERLKAALPAADCATRHDAVWPSGRRKGRRRFAPCGHCQEGARVLERLRAAGWEPPAPSQPAEVLPASRGVAKRGHLAALPVPTEEELGDVLRDAASMTPDARTSRQAEEW